MKAWLIAVFLFGTLPAELQAQEPPWPAADGFRPSVLFGAGPAFHEGSLLAYSAHLSGQLEFIRPIITPVLQAGGWIFLMRCDLCVPVGIDADLGLNLQLNEEPGHSYLGLGLGAAAINFYGPTLNLRVGHRFGRNGSFKAEIRAIMFPSHGAVFIPISVGI